MSDDKFQDKYRINTARAWWHDYDGGAYFITICTKGREHYFGEIEDGKILLSEIGDYSRQCIEQISQHNPYAEIPLYVIMPNHLHLIVFIVETVHAPSPKNHPFKDNLETVHAPSLQPSRWKNDNVDKEMQFISKKKHRLAVTIGSLKSAITHFANQNAIDFAWQPRFHDRIIRDQPEMNRIATYIENNVANWKDDEFYTPRK